VSTDRLPARRRNVGGLSVVSLETAVSFVGVRCGTRAKITPNPLAGYG
jgi:hypothetical protein